MLSYERMVLLMLVLPYSNFGCYVVGLHMGSAGLFFCNATVLEPVKEKKRGR